MNLNLAVAPSSPSDHQYDGYTVLIAAFFVISLYLQHALPIAIRSIPLLFTTFSIPVLVFIAVKRVYFDKLSSFPGPALWSVSRLPMFYHLCRGTLPSRISELHAKYGKVVRVAPTELSFVAEEAWAPIYNKPTHRPQLQKDPTQFVKNTLGGGMFQEASDQMHGQVRRHFSHAFADKTVAEQEAAIQSYITLFLQRISEANTQSLDICLLLNCLTFDIVGDLAFSQSFNALRDSKLHPWIENIFEHVAAMIIFGMLQKFKLVYSFLTTVLRKPMRAAEDKHFDFIVDRITQRLSTNPERRDFMTHVQKHLNQPSGLTHAQLYSTTSQIIIGGSETTSTILSATLYLLLSHPSTLSTLQQELRALFPSSSSINIQNINRLTAEGELKYLHAVIQEGMRLYAPTPGNLTRVTPTEGIQVGEKWFVPGDTLVGVNLHAAARYEHNFHDAAAFIPERWLSNPPSAHIHDKLKAIQPFSIGPRNCIGKNLANMEMRLILTRLIFEYEIELDERSRGWDKGMKSWGFYARAPLMIKFSRREDVAV